MISRELRGEGCVKLPFLNQPTNHHRPNLELSKRLGQLGQFTIPYGFSIGTPMGRCWNHLNLSKDKYILVNRTQDTMNDSLEVAKLRSCDSPPLRSKPGISEFFVGSDISLSGHHVSGDTSRKPNFGNSPLFHCNFLWIQTSLKLCGGKCSETKKILLVLEKHKPDDCWWFRNPSQTTSWDV